MTREDLAERLDAVERRLDAAYPEPGEPADDERVEEFADRLADLEAAVEAIEGYVGEVERVDDALERRADAALAAVDDVEATAADLEATTVDLEATTAELRWDVDDLADRLAAVDGGAAAGARPPADAGAAGGSGAPGGPAGPTTGDDGPELGRTDARGAVRDPSAGGETPPPTEPHVGRGDGAGAVPPATRTSPDGGGSDVRGSARGATDRPDRAGSAVERSPAPGSHGAPATGEPPDTESRGAVGRAPSPAGRDSTGGGDESTVSGWGPAAADAPRAGTARDGRAGTGAAPPDRDWGDPDDERSLRQRLRELL